MMSDKFKELKDCLPEPKLTWDMLLRLFYSLCAWLVIGTIIGTIVGISDDHTPIGVLRRSLDWLEVPSAFTHGMEDWYAGHSVLLGCFGIGVIIVSACLSCGVDGLAKRAAGGEIPPFCLGFLLFLQSFGDKPSTSWSWICLRLVLAWIIYFIFFVFKKFKSKTSDNWFDLIAPWPLAMFFTIVYPLVMVRWLLFGNSN